MGRISDEWLDEACKVLQNNPKRGKSADRYESYKRARTLGAIMELGGLRADISHDLLRGFIVLEDKSKHKQLLAIIQDKAEVVDVPKKKKIVRPPPEKKEEVMTPRKRAMLDIKGRVRNFNRTVGRGRLLPILLQERD